MKAILDKFLETHTLTVDKNKFLSYLEKQLPEDNYLEAILEFVEISDLEEWFLSDVNILEDKFRIYTEVELLKLCEEIYPVLNQKLVNGTVKSFIDKDKLLKEFSYKMEHSDKTGLYIERIDEFFLRGITLEWSLNFMRAEILQRVEDEKVFIHTAEGKVLEYGKDDLSDLLENTVCLIEVKENSVHITLGKEKVYSLLVELDEVIDKIRVADNKTIEIFTVDDKVLKYGKDDIKDVLDRTIALIDIWNGDVAIHLED